LLGRHLFGCPLKKRGSRWRVSSTVIIKYLFCRELPLCHQVYSLSLNAFAVRQYEREHAE